MNLLDSCLEKVSLGDPLDSLTDQAWGECIRIPSELAQQLWVIWKAKESEPSWVTQKEKVWAVPWARVTRKEEDKHTIRSAKYQS